MFRCKYNIADSLWDERNCLVCNSFFTMLCIQLLYIEQHNFDNSQQHFFPHTLRIPSSYDLASGYSLMTNIAISLILLREFFI
jgi:hypothetical protein